MMEPDKSDKLNRLLDDLRHAIAQGAIVVVEGPNDEKALRAFGISGRIEQLSKKPITDLVQRLSRECKEVIILTDFDTYGQRAARMLRDSFLNECVNANMSFRTRFKKLLGYTHFEDTPTLFEKETNR